MVLQSPASVPPGAATQLRGAIRTLAVISSIATAFAILYALVLWSGSDDWMVYLDSTLPIGLLLALVTCAFVVVRSNHLLILTPLPWFYVACAAYFGVGALIYHQANDATISLAHAFYFVGERDLLRTNLLNCVGIAIVSLTCWAILRRVPALPIYPRGGNRSQLLRLVGLFLLVGLPVKYFLTLPADFQVLSFELPGSVKSIAMFSSLALFTLAFLRARGEVRFGFWAKAFLVSEVAVSLITFSKMESLITILMFFLGWYIARPRLRLLLLVGSVGIVFYLAMAPFVVAMREQLADAPVEEHGYEARIALLSKYLFGSDTRQAAAFGGDEAQIWWFRLNYANAQTFAMTEYDTGKPGDTFDNVLLSFVPRFVWPEKPQISTGKEFNEMICGSDESSSGPGVFAEAYWNGGWPIVVLTCIYVGGLFSLFTWFTLRAMTRYDFRWLPGAFVGVFIGGQIVDLFVLTYVTMIGVTALYYLAISRVIFPDWQQPDGVTPG